MAILAIAKAPEIFGFGDVMPDAPFEYDTVEVRSGVKLKDAAKCAGVRVEEMRSLNSELTRDCTPAGSDSYQLRIPKGKTDLFLAEYSKLPLENFTIPSETAPETATTHKVRRGDTLASVSRKYGVTVAALMRSNHLKRSSRLKSGQRLTIPGASAPGEDIVADSDSDDNPVSERRSKSSASRKSPKRVSNSSAAPDTVTYVVKRHDSLSAIAARYGVSHKDLMKWNRIESPRKVAAGTRLVIKTNR
jgi:membrane-bound lytic murein transglycosylase D